MLDKYIHATATLRAKPTITDDYTSDIVGDSNLAFEVIMDSLQSNNHC